jgi:hypothetical protein
MSNKYTKNGMTAYSKTGSVVIGDRRIFNPTDEQLVNDGWVLQANNKPSVKQLIAESDAKINKETDKRILYDFSWMGETFHLSLENQFNYKNLYDLRELKSYPVLLKTNSGFMQLENAEEVSQFYLAVVNFVELCIKDGWLRKAEAAEEIRKEYESVNQ